MPGLEVTVRLTQLAKAMGVSATEVIARLAEKGHELQPPYVKVPLDYADDVLEDVTAAGDLAAARELVVRAFETARSSGKEDWRTMSLAVLKNRLLDLTDGGFSEFDYASPTFTHFAYRFSDVLSFEVPEVGQIRATIREEALPELEASPSAQIPPPTYERLRSDLWRALVDYSSGKTYVWDLRERQALQGQEGPGRLLIPTLSPLEEAEWREEFSKTLDGKLDPAEAEQVHAWKSQRLQTRALPPELRGPWNGYVRQHVAQRIDLFFSQHDIEPPSDLLVSADEQSRTELSHAESDLRRLIRRLIAVMTEAELESLSIPAAAYIRLHGRG